MSPSVLGVHLVGSIRLPDEPEDPLADPPSAGKVFETLCKALPGRLSRIPDGETGVRHYFVRWQDRAFTSSPWLLHDMELKEKNIPIPDDDDTSNLEIKLDPTGYDTHAIESYSTFATLQQTGAIPASTRFQVSLPTPLNVLLKYVRPAHQARVEPLYEALLRDAILSIQSRIPASKLAIQIDCALEFAALEGVSGPGDVYKPWFEPGVSALVDRIERIVLPAIHPDVELGFHLCYGDVEHRHFREPGDAGKLVGMANGICARFEAEGRRVGFVHLPVPKGREDEGYFAPLKGLRLQKGTRLYLGLVHAHDREGTERRIRAAGGMVGEFGIATECGWGRTPVGDVQSILEILRELSTPGEVQNEV